MQELLLRLLVDYCLRLAELVWLLFKLRYCWGLIALQAHGRYLVVDVVRVKESLSGPARDSRLFVLSKELSRSAVHSFVFAYNQWGAFLFVFPNWSSYKLVNLLQILNIGDLLAMGSLALFFVFLRFGKHLIVH